MSSALLYILLAIVAGFCLPTQAGINAKLSLHTQSPITAAAISFAVGTAGLVAWTFLGKTQMPLARDLAQGPWWIWIGGFLGAFFVASTIILAPKLGATSMVALIITGQLGASLVLDHLGWLGYTSHPINFMRILGVGLLIVGGLLINKF